MNLTKAANELQAIRNELAAGRSEGLLARCDAVGMWLAGQKWSKKVAQLGGEAHDISVELDGVKGVTGPVLFHKYG